MDFSEFKEERLLNMLKQSYSFNEEQVAKAKIELLKRGKITEQEAQNLLEASSLMGEKVQAEEQAEREKQHEKDLLLLKIQKIVIACLFVLSFGIWYFTGWIFILFLAPAAGAGSYFRNRSRFR